MEIIGAGDWTVAQGLFRGVDAQPWPGSEPTNRPYEVSQCDLVRWEKGKIAEEHWYYDLHTVLVQLGHVPVMTPNGPSISSEPGYAMKSTSTSSAPNS